MNTQLALALPPAAPSNTVIINARCTLRAEEHERVIVVGGLPVHHYQSDDVVAQAYAMVLLVDSGFAQQTEVARGFGKSERTVRRHQERYAQGGMVALGRPEGWRRSRRRISGKRLRIIERLKSQGLSNRAVAQRLGVHENAIRKLVGPSRGEPLEQLSLGTIGSAPLADLPLSVSPEAVVAVGAACVDPTKMRSANDPAADSAVFEEDPQEAEPVPMSLDCDASDRSFDRQLAHLGLLDDAAPIFREGSQVPGAGVLLALPCLIESGLLRISRKLYGEIGPAFYGLRTTLLTLMLMALLRIQRPEHLKERDPAAFGRLLGLDRAARRSRPSGVD